MHDLAAGAQIPLLPEINFVTSGVILKLSTPQITYKVGIKIELSW